MVESVDLGRPASRWRLKCDPSVVTRLVSAFIALPITLYLIGLGSWWYGSLLLLVAAISLHEFFGMTQPDDVPAQVGLTGAGVGLVYGAITGGLEGPGALTAFAITLVAVLTYFLLRTGTLETVAHRLGLAMLGLAWAGGLLAIVGVLRLLPNGAGWIVLACGLAWGSDSGAYFVGRAFGRRKLYPKISPQKTWEGAIAGIVTATAMVFGVRAVLSVDISVVDLLVLAPIGAAFGQIGDLAESMLKRSVGVKDSGRIMPGHGGLFDRLDALLFTGPVVFIYAVGWRGLELLYLPSVLD